MKTINFSTMLLKMGEARFWPAPSGQDKKFQFALKIGWRALASGEPTKTFPNWRRGRDSNSRYPLTEYGGLANRCLQPLGHLSKI